jgi:hypothetical protein
MITDANNDLKDQISRLEASLKAVLIDNARAADARMTRASWAVASIVTLAIAVSTIAH